MSGKWLGIFCLVQEDLRCEFDMDSKRDQVVDRFYLKKMEEMRVSGRICTQQTKLKSPACS